MAARVTAQGGYARCICGVRFRYSSVTKMKEHQCNEQVLMDKWQAMKSKDTGFMQNRDYCPTCKRPLPGEGHNGECLHGLAPAPDAWDGGLSLSPQQLHDLYPDFYPKP